MLYQKMFQHLNGAKMQKRKIMTILSVVLLIVALFLIENSTHFLRRIIDDAFYDNYHHYLRCDELPSLEEVKDKVTDHQSTIDMIKNLDVNSVYLQVDSTSCSGKGSIVISYPSNAIRKQVEDILGGMTFYGIPITLINQ